jgi:arylsulfatase A-like enzyme
MFAGFAATCRPPRFLLALALLGCMALMGCGDAPNDPDQAGSSATSGGSSSATGDQMAPSVVLISIDSLRADHCTPYGYRPEFAPELETTPFLKRLAQEGILFENASSAAPWTLPSHISLFTAQAPREHGVRLGRSMLEHGTENLAGRFKAEGYATFGIYSAPFLHPAYGYGLGFDGYRAAEDYLKKGSTSAAITNPGARQMTPVHGFADGTFGNAPRVNEMALEFLDSRVDQDEPFFLFLHYWDVHYNYVPPVELAKQFLPDYSAADAEMGANFTPPQVERSGKSFSAAELSRIKALYDAEIRATDDAIAEVYAKLEALGMADQVIFAVVSDHGDHFGEQHDGQTYLFHHRTLYQEVVHVPVVIKAPGLVPAGQKIAGSVGLYDVGPTLLDLAGLAPWPGRSGRSARDLWENPQQNHAVLMDLLHPGVPSDAQAWRFGNFKAIWEHGMRNRKAVRAEDFRYFDLAQDPHEIKPMSSLKGNPLVDHARQALLDARQNAAQAFEMKELPDEITKGLQDSGYEDSMDGPPPHSGNSTDPGSENG